MRDTAGRKHLYAWCQKLYMRSLWFDLRRRDVGVRHRVREKKNNISQKKNYYVSLRKNAQQILALQFKKNKIISGAHECI